MPKENSAHGFTEGSEVVSPARELAKEIFNLTEELRLANPMLRLEKEDDLIDYWENKIKATSPPPPQVNLWQSCPHCYGVGKEPTGNFMVRYTIFDCTVCNGKKIISTLTGKPPL
jgi:hypothetical protein